jgi:hypothetical protein
LALTLAERPLLARIRFVPKFASKPDSIEMGWAVSGANAATAPSSATLDILLFMSIP